ncbi:MAG: nuclear transport factor 2 family protein, partial [Actinomycetia bacterium]|nr:nuclear transport factor 2 family protein [Actinomycetes bacterium]
RKAAAAELRRSAARGHDPRHELADLTRRLDRSKAYDGAVNVNSVYTTFLDDNNCAAVGQIHAQHGHKSSPGAGYYLGPDRIDEACAVFYGHTPPTSRSGISFHWEPQPVILVSHDGRSANIRTRLFKMRTATSTTGSFFRPMLAGAMYNNQAVLEDGIWRLWDTTIDEEYWGMDSWDEGWAGVEPRDPDAPPPPPRDLIEEYPPDLLLADMGEREQGLWGGTGTFIEWPDIVPMWFNYRNLVSGRVPEHYQSDCAPCGVKPSWSMVHYGYQLPPNGPSNDGVNIPVTPH